MNSLIEVISGMGNPFMDDCPELVVLDTHNCVTYAQYKLLRTALPANIVMGIYTDVVIVLTGTFFELQNHYSYLDGIQSWQKLYANVLAERLPFL